MGSLEDLPADQRAVLQMVLQRGRSYDEIAAVLSIDRSAVRQRALDACLALTPDYIESGPERTLVTDYLLGQLPAQVAEQVYVYLEAADADREWAQLISQRLATIAVRPLAEVPVGAPLRADGPDVPGHEPEPEPPTGTTDEASERYEGAQQAHPDDDVGQPVAEQPQHERPPPSPRGRLSQRTGALGAGLVGVIVAIVAVIVLTSGGSSPSNSGSGGASTAPPVTTSTTSTRSGTTTTSTTSTTPQILAALNLTSPVGARKTLGLAQVIREQDVVGIVIDAQGMPPNSAHNAYALWLSNSATSNEFVGFVQNLVGKSGRLTAEGELPANAAHYKRLLITVETQQAPKTPGEVVLSGPFREHS